MRIEDGTGNGYCAEVNIAKRLKTSATVVSAEHAVNHDEEEAYQVVFSQSPTAAGDCIFFMQNTSDSDLIVEGIRLAATDVTADDYVYFQLGDSGTRNSATALTPVNCNAGSGNTADGTFEYGADLDGGAATLTGGSEFDRIVFAGVTDSSSTNYNFEMDIILPKNKVLTIWVGGSATGTITGVIPFYYTSTSE